jgi:hypothetical protein
MLQTIDGFLPRPTPLAPLAARPAERRAVFDRLSTPHRPHSTALGGRRAMPAGPHRLAHQPHPAAPALTNQATAPSARPAAFQPVAAPTLAAPGRSPHAFQPGAITAQPLAAPAFQPSPAAVQPDAALAHSIAPNGEIEHQAYRAPATRKRRGLPDRLQMTLIITGAVVAGIFAQSVVFGEIMIGVYGVAALIWRISSRTTFTLALLSFIATAVMLVVRGNVSTAQNFATYTFLLLVVGVITLIRELKKEGGRIYSSRKNIS